MRTVLRTEHSVLSSQYSVPSSQFSALSTQCLELSTQHSVLSTQHSLLGFQRSVLSAQSSVSSTQYLELNIRGTIKFETGTGPPGGHTIEPGIETSSERLQHSLFGELYIDGDGIRNRPFKIMCKDRKPHKLELIC